MTVTKDKIYTLFNGSDKGDINCDNVLVYDWDGNPMQKIILDRKCIGIAIDEDNPKILYGLYGSTNMRLVKYKLP